MDPDKTDPAQLPQTLLEAAAATIDWWGIGSMPDQIRSLKAAIAREEAKQAVVESTAPFVMWMDRAQQAESSAAWHKAESERLSAELAKAKEFRSYAEEAANFGGKWRERAEKAEAEMDKVRHDNQVSLMGVRSDLRSFAQTSMDALNLLLKALGGKS